MKKSEIKKPQPKIVPGWVNFVIGGTSGMMSVCIVQPADLVKTRMQLLKKSKKTSMINLVKTIAKTEGILGFYTGLSAALMRQATYTTARMGCFNTIFDNYKRNYGVPHYFVRVLMGIVSGGIGAFIGTPTEVALVRMTADGRLPPEKRRNYKCVLDALHRMLREEGVAALWTGATITMTRAMVVNGVQLATYSQVRETLMQYLGNGMSLHIISSIISGLVTSSVSLPVDNIKTRIQSAKKGASAVSVFAKVIRKDGVLALWSGFIPTYARMGPHTVFTFLFMEQLTKLYLSFA